MDNGNHTHTAFYTHANCIDYHYVQCSMLNVQVDCVGDYYSKAMTWKL